MPALGKTSPLKIDHFAEFENCFGDDPTGKTPRKDQGETGRFRCFTREEIVDRNENLDISWLRDESDETDETPNSPEEIATEILGHLRAALSEIEAVSNELTEPVGVEE
jgi:type I restriction enzyme M protein